LIAVLLLSGSPATSSFGCDEKADRGSSRESEAKKAKDKPVGSPCTKASECRSSICLDLSKVDDGCKGKVCTMACQENSDCPKVAKHPDCDPVQIGSQKKRLCLYGEWEKKYCK
jgi:hypothetical protein